MYLREAHAKKARVLAESFLMIGSQLPQSLLDEIELIELILAWKERISVHQFSHYAASCP